MSTAAEDTTVQDAPAAEESTADRPQTPQATSAATAAATEGTKDPATTPSQNKKNLELVIGKATKQYGLKNYAHAAEFYAEAAEIQAKMNGEDNPLNADLLYLYGRALFQCGVAKSDVLGGGVDEASGAGAAGKDKGKKGKKDGGGSGGGGGSGNDDGGVGSSKSAAAAAESSLDPKPKANFHFSGDENFTESEEEDEGEEGEGGEDEGEQDDFTLAWEILDLARVLFLKRLETPPEDEKDLRKIKESLSDVYDLLGEVSLESESFKQAVDDLSESLRLKQEIYAPESTLISEAHYKLSLALEFASQGGGEGDAEAEVSEEDQKEGRKKWADHMKLAIESCKRRISLEEKALADTAGDTVNGKPRDRAEKSLLEARELVKELEQRLRDLTVQPQQIQMGDEQILGGLLGSLIGKNPAEAKKHLEQAISGAKDLGGMVRKKEKQPEAAASSSSSAAAANGSAAESSAAAGSKRKAEDEAPADEKPDTEMTSAAEPSSKKARVTTEEEEQASTA